MLPFLAGTQITHWGMKGSSWLVGKYSKKTHKHLEHDAFEETHFAELWWGTHPKFPSTILINEDIRKYLTPEYYETNKDKYVSLGDAILENKSVFLTDNYPFEIEGKSAGCLPYLLKVLSVDSPLSIQAHPDKKLAEILHAEQPDIYPDDNHKPEMIIALSDFDALCRFSTGAKIHNRISSIPALKWFFADVNLDDLLDESKCELAWRSIIKVTFDSSAEQVHECIQGILTHIESIAPSERSRHHNLALYLNGYYPSDVGVIVSFLLNYYKLKYGECLMVGANQPHAWIKGECIEVQASSDNVVRGGLTPKFKDAKTLNQMLSYETTSEIDINAEGIDLGYVIDYDYNTGYKEMKTKRYFFPASEEQKSEHSVDYYCTYQAILIVISKGQGIITDSTDSTEYKVGYLDSFYLLPERSFNIRSDSNQEFEVFIASINE